MKMDRHLYMKDICMMYDHDQCEYLATGDEENKQCYMGNHKVLIGKIDQDRFSSVCVW